MFQKRFVPVALAVCFLVAPVHAFASEKDNGVDLAALEKAPTTLAQAIGTVEKQAGGKAFAAEADFQGGALAYRVETLGDGKPVAFDVSSLTGQVLASKNQGFWDRLFGEDAEVETVSPVGLQQAVETIEAGLGGKVVHAEFDAEKGNAVFKATALTESGERKVVLDAATGKIVKDEIENETRE